MQQLGSLLLKEGIADLGVGEIAARLQCSRRRLYEVADNKNGLLLAVARRHFEEGIARGERAALEQTDPQQKLLAFAKAGVETAIELSTPFLRDLESTPEGSAMFDAYQRARAEGGRALLEEGIRQGLYNAHNAMVATEIALGAAMRLRRAEFLAEAGLTLEQAMEEAYHLMHHGLLTRSSNQPLGQKTSAAKMAAGAAVKPARKARS